MSPFSSPNTPAQICLRLYYILFELGSPALHQFKKRFRCMWSQWSFFLFFFRIISVCVSSRWIYWYCLAVNLIFVHIEVHLTHVRMWSRRAIEALWLTVEKNQAQVLVFRGWLYIFIDKHNGAFISMCINSRLLIVCSVLVV